MSRPKLHCGDFFLFCLLFWAVVDLARNWKNYQACEKPMGEWIIVSMSIIIAMRTYQLIAFAITYGEIKEQIQPRVNIN
jgi:hypothetical protein